MTRKDTEKDSERPHYYSQFWLDVAAGRRIIGTPKTEEGEPIEPEGLEPEPAPQRRTGKAFEQDLTQAMANGYATEATHGSEVAESDEEEAAPEFEEEEFETAYPEDSSVVDTDIPDVDLDIEEEEEPEEEEEFLQDEEEPEDEEDDDLSWGGRGGRKKPKPSRPTKPVSKKPGKRDSRRGY